MSPQDDHEPEKSPAPPPRPLAPPMRRRSRRRGTRGYYRKRSASQVLKGSWLFRLFIVAAVLVFAVMHWKYGLPSGPSEWITWFRWLIQDSGFIFFSLGAGIFLIGLFVTGSHFKTAIQRLRAKGDDKHAIPVSYYVLWGTKVRSGSGKNGRKSHWQWWRDWLIILIFPYGFILTLFILIFLYYFLPRNGSFAIAHFYVAHFGALFLISIIAVIGLAYLLDATWKWREKKYVKSGFSLIGGALVIALCVHLSGIALSSLLSSVPDVFAAPKTTDTAQCLSSATERGVDGEGHRNASPRREYTQYHFVIVDGNSEPFDVYLTAYDDEGDNPVIRTIQRHCGSKETFTLVYYPGSKTVVEAR